MHLLIFEMVKFELLKLAFSILNFTPGSFIATELKKDRCRDTNEWLGYKKRFKGSPNALTHN
jgi:hypothetical protein